MASVIDKKDCIDIFNDIANKALVVSDKDKFNIMFGELLGIRRLLIHANIINRFEYDKMSKVLIEVSGKRVNKVSLKLF